MDKEDTDKTQEPPEPPETNIQKEILELKETVNLLLKERELRSKTTKRSRSRSKSRSCSPSHSRVKSQKTKTNKDPSVVTDPLDSLSDTDHSADDVEDEDDDCLKQLEDFYGTSAKSGDKVDEKLAKVVDAGLCKRFLSEDKLKLLSEKYPVPANCENIRVPKTNPEVWKNLYKNQKLRDVRLQKTQKVVTQNISASVTLLDMIRQARKTKSQLNLKLFEELVTDTVRLNSCCFSDISELRRTCMKPGLSVEYQSLGTSDSDITTEFLFGNNLEKRGRNVSCRG